jgi:hypothetical protein
VLSHTKFAYGNNRDKETNDNIKATEIHVFVAEPALFIIITTSYAGVSLFSAHKRIPSH